MYQSLKTNEPSFWEVVAACTDCVGPASDLKGSTAYCEDTDTQNANPSGFGTGVENGVKRS